MLVNSCYCILLEHFLSIDAEACGIGWKRFSDTCYKIVTYRKTWERSVADCRSAGAHLVKVTSQEELDYLFFTFVKPLHSGSAWIGLNLKEGSFYWTDNSKLQYKNWNYGEPNNFNGNEHCVEIYVNNGRWNDIPCFYKRPYVCEKGNVVITTYKYTLFENLHETSLLHTYLLCDTFEFYTVKYPKVIFSWLVYSFKRPVGVVD